MFYGAIGVIDGSINFGSSDKAINKYISGTNGVLSVKTEARIDLLVKGINEISELYDNTIQRSNKRYIKLLFLLLGFGKFTFENGSIEDALMKLYEVNNRLSAFTSAKKDIVDQTFAVFNGEGNLKEIIEDYRQIALFSRGTQVHATTVERIALLHHIIERELMVK